MRKLMFALLALAISLFGTQCWAQGNCSGGEGVVVSCDFSPGITEGIYDFTGTGDGRLVVDFVTVRPPGFTLTVTVNHTIDFLAEGVFPPTTVCVTYVTNGSQCDEYDFSGNAGGPNGVPVKGFNYRGLITATLEYFTAQTAQTPAFLHAPGDNPGAVYTENILTSYSAFPPCGGLCDPTMKGTLPNLSTLAAFDEHLPSDAFCLVSPQPPATFQVGQEIEVAFRLTPPTTSCTTNTGNSIRDKDAQLSVVDSQGNFQTIRDREEGNKFHFDSDDGVNERDLNTKGLLPGTYTVTLFSDEFSPYSFTITLTACTTDCNQ